MLILLRPTKPRTRNERNLIRNESRRGGGPQWLAYGCAHTKDPQIRVALPTPFSPSIRENLRFGRRTIQVSIRDKAP
jgi:hypothetical protein